VKSSHTSGAFPATLVVLLVPSLLAAQGSQSPAPESPTAPVAVLTAALYNDQANLKESSDSLQASLATEVIRARLHEDLGDQLTSYAIIDSLTDSPEASRIAGGVPCQVRVACARAVASRAGARWVVMTKVSKTSNLIWLLSAQLIRVSTGEIVLDDSTELKGDPGPMVRIGVRSFADRVARTVRAGGHTTNFPHGEPQ
jgi:Protein of unknown function (DUF2380)